jgi:hypothetical protein
VACEVLLSGIVRHLGFYDAGMQVNCIWS